MPLGYTRQSYQSDFPAGKNSCKPLPIPAFGGNNRLLRRVIRKNLE